jgi:hypothetical protein
LKRRAEEISSEEAAKLAKEMAGWDF